MSSGRQQGLHRHQSTISDDARSITVTATDWAAGAQGTGHYAEVNGINLYFEMHGAGRPLILLHGGLGSGEMFGPVLPTLAERHQVIAVVSANIRRDAIYPEMLAQQGQVSAAAAEFMKDTPMYQLYQRVAPHPGDFPGLLDKIGEAMSKDFDFTEQVRGLPMPALIVAADADMAPPSHYVEVFKLLDGGLRDGGWMGEGRPKGGHALAILPGLTHYNIFSSPLFAAATLAFLDNQPS
jgi:pimeloyl-ACP methyl ester carboxylesterase